MSQGVGITPIHLSKFFFVEKKGLKKCINNFSKIRHGFKFRQMELIEEKKLYYLVITLETRLRLLLYLFQHL